MSNERYTLPDGWAWATLGKAVTLNMGQSPRGTFTNDIGEGLPLIGGASDLANNGPRPTRYTSRPTKVCRQGDVIVCVRATIGKIVKADREYCLGRGVAGISPEPVNGDFLRWYLTSEVEQLRDLGTGTTFKQISKDDLHTFPIPLAPLPEQRRIVEKIAALFEQSRTARQALDRIPPLLKKFRHSVLAAAFRGDLTRDWRKQNPDVEPPSALLERIRAERLRTWEDGLRAAVKDPRRAKYEEPRPPASYSPPPIPETWVWTNIDSLISDARYGTSQKCTEKPQGVAILRIPNVVRGELELTDLKFADINDEELLKLLVQPGDLLVVRTNGSLDLVGKAALVPELPRPCAFASYLIRLRPVLASILARYIDLVFRSDFARDCVEAKARSTAGQFNLNLETLRSIYLPLPPLDEMRRLIQTVEALLRHAASIETAVDAARRRADRIEQAILARAFRGELVPQDPNDEPASALLERVRRESIHRPKLRSIGKRRDEHEYR
jgi:type I restriction enzyme S subunit